MKDRLVVLTSLGVCCTALKLPVLPSRRLLTRRFVQEESVQEEESLPAVDKDAPPEEENPDQPDIIKKFVKQRDDWWSTGAFASPLGGKDDATAAPIEAIATLPLPSYFWLLTSTVLSIAFVGSIFQLFYNVPRAPVLGVPLTSAILATSGPAFIFLFLVAIRKGQKEADEDDARYS